jgi:hypothetical protein
MEKTFDFNEALKERIAKAQEQHKQQMQKSFEALLDNEEFVETQRSIQAKEHELTMLNSIITQLNSITPFIAKDGRKFSVNVFPIPVFGPGHGHVLGIIAGSRSAFIDEKMLEYSAITGLTQLELIEAREALGSPAYFSNGEVVEAIPGDFHKLSNLLKGIYLKLGLSEFKPEEVTEEKWKLWFQLAENRAMRAKQEHEDLKKLQASAGDFLIEE